MKHMQDCKFFSYNALATAIKNEFNGASNVNVIFNKKFVKESKFGQYVRPLAIVIDRKRYTSQELAVVLKQKSFFVNVKDTHYTVIKNSNIDFFSIALNLSEQKEYKKAPCAEMDSKSPPGETNVKYYPSSLKTITNKDVIQKFLPKVEEASIDIDEGSEMVEEIDPEAL
ncbi:hypothetical protein TVAGG3_0209740 [Trichomonas vaginalis G3]|uniref:hypothetical protein n=4 Tax=Trichomonas vaginalis (strain ATCC PRA-98 / G3) TaxID=412133 RepID=UPI0021E6268E|nr:hypothetical protein TVAGG3_0209740 [Trichomonas vaginalis G3]KAI5551157.1 hypothetical protein TVAGG3_0209740 [Trichomonas vaginalis G3]